MKIEKGQPGYIKARNMRYLLYAVVEFAMVAAVFILGYVQTKSRLNLFTVLAYYWMSSGSQDAGGVYYNGSL